MFFGGGGHGAGGDVFSSFFDGGLFGGINRVISECMNPLVFFSWAPGYSVHVLNIIMRYLFSGGGRHRVRKPEPTVMPLE